MGIRKAGLIGHDYDNKTKERVPLDVPWNQWTEDETDEVAYPPVASKVGQAEA